MSEPTISIGIGDWVDHYNLAEPQIVAKEDLIAARKKYHAADVAKFALVAREKGDAPEHLLRPNKLLLLSGVMLDIASYVASKRQVVTVGEDERAIEIHAYVAPVKEEDDVEDEDDIDGQYSAGPIVDVISQQATEFATRYLHRNVLGRVRERLAIVAANKEDVRAVAEGFVAQVWRIVDQLT